MVVGHASSGRGVAANPVARGVPTPQVAPTLAVAAAVVAIIEVAVARVGAPLIGFLASDGTPAVDVLAAVGRGATSAAALLVVVASGALLLGRRPWTLASTAFPLAAVVLTVAAAMRPSPALLALGHLVVSAAAIGVALGVAEPGSAGRAVAALAALAVAAGQLAFSATGEGVTALHALAQAALVALPIAAAWRFRAEFGRFGWVAAATVAVGVWAALLVRGPELAMLSTWAVGATLTLPSVALIAAAAGWVLLTTAAVRRSGMRLVVAGVTLPFVAGIQPTAIHHNLTGLLGIMLLVGFAAERRAVAEGDRP